MLGGTVQMMFDFTPKNILIWLVILGGISVLQMLFMPQLMGLQSYFAIRGAKNSLDKLESWSERSKRTALEKITEYGRPVGEIRDEFENFLEFFAIEPVSEDPSGVLDRLEHLLDVRKTRYEDEIRELAPEASDEEIADLETAVEAAASSHAVYKIVRHYIAVAEKTKSMQLAQMLQMQMPMLEKTAEAYRNATEAFAEGKAIGDGVGAMVAGKLMNGSEVKEEVEDTVHAETKIEGRRVFVIKAKGPGGRTGKPGELIEELSQKHKPDRILMVDAGQKLEGEESGKIVEGVGAAIGGPPTEKHKIEKLATEKDIPLDAVVVKEGFKEAITPMTKPLSESTETVVEKVKRTVRNRTEKKDTVFVAGIGNTLGVGQDPESIEADFPEKEEEEDELESFASLPGMGSFLNRLG
ncbi:MAG: DUF1512 family protein, partial [Candidatus Aenigmatarchaeota archaeon]